MNQRIKLVFERNEIFEKFFHSQVSQVFHLMEHPWFGHVASGQVKLVLSAVQKAIFTRKEEQ